MRMAWWIFMGLLTIQIIFLQYMVEEYLAEEYEELIYYAGALGFVFVCSAIVYYFFNKTDEVSED